MAVVANFFSNFVLERPVKRTRLLIMRSFPCLRVIFLSLCSLFSIQGGAFIDHFDSSFGGTETVFNSFFWPSWIGTADLDAFCFSRPAGVPASFP